MTTTTTLICISKALTGIIGNAGVEVSQSTLNSNQRSSMSMSQIFDKDSISREISFDNLSNLTTANSYDNLSTAALAKNNVNDVNKSNSNINVNNNVINGSTSAYDLTGNLSSNNNNYQSNEQDITQEITNALHILLRVFVDYMQ